MAETTANTAELRLPPADRGWQQTLWTILGALMFGAFLVAALVWTAPVLLSDWQVRETAQSAANADVVKGRCHSKLVLNICDATLRVRTPTATVSREVSYVFTGLHLGDYNVRALVDPARPELVTTDLGLDQLWNRTITLAVGVMLLLALSVMPLVSLVRRRSAA